MGWEGKGWDVVGWVGWDETGWGWPSQPTLLMTYLRCLHRLQSTPPPPPLPLPQQVWLPLSTSLRPPHTPYGDSYREDLV